MGARQITGKQPKSEPVYPKLVGVHVGLCALSGSAEVAVASQQAAVLTSSLGLCESARVAFEARHYFERDSHTGGFVSARVSSLRRLGLGIGAKQDTVTLVVGGKFDSSATVSPFVGVQLGFDFLD